jgi:predicted nucleotidyltransferase
MGVMSYPEVSGVRDKNHEYNRVGGFSSWARGDHRPEGDTDIFIEFDSPVPDHRF